MQDRISFTTETTRETFVDLDVSELMNAAQDVDWVTIRVYMTPSDRRPAVRTLRLPAEWVRESGRGGW